MDGISKLPGKADIPMELYHEESIGGSQQAQKRASPSLQASSVLAPPGHPRAAVPTPAYGLEAILRGDSSEHRERQEDKTLLCGQLASGRSSLMGHRQALLRQATRRLETTARH